MLHVETRDAWMAWLARHHDSEKEIWLVYNKKASGRPRVRYDEAVEDDSAKKDETRRKRLREAVSRSLKQKLGLK
jgi:hypothetical protein